MSSPTSSGVRPSPEILTLRLSSSKSVSQTRWESQLGFHIRLRSLRRISSSTSEPTTPSSSMLAAWLEAAARRPSVRGRRLIFSMARLHLLPVLPQGEADGHADLGAVEVEHVGVDLPEVDGDVAERVQELHR